MIIVYNIQLYLYCSILLPTITPQSVFHFLLLYFTILLFYTILLLLFCYSTTTTILLFYSAMLWPYL